jgi:hypothetical protein
MGALKQINIRDVWEEIRPGVETVVARGGGDWRAEDLYAACVNGTAWLWMSEEGDFCVLQLQRNEYRNQLECFVWAAYNRGDIEAHLQQVGEIAREAGAKRLVMSSARRGWERRPEWRKLHSTYALEI